MRDHIIAHFYTPYFKAIILNQLIIVDFIGNHLFLVVVFMFVVLKMNADKI
jgi:hypothetical protein